MSEDEPHRESREVSTSQSAPLTVLAFECALSPIAGVLGAALDCSPIRSIAEGATGWRDDVAAVAWGVAAALPPLAGLWWSRRAPFEPLRKLQQLVNRLIVPLFARCRLWELALISLFAGLGEELLFRGLMQDFLAEWCGDRWGGSVGLAFAIVLSSLTFGLLHALSRTYFFLATAMSIYLGVLHATVGNVLAPAAAHAVYDFAALAIFIRAAGASAAAHDSRRGTQS